MAKILAQKKRALKFALKNKKNNRGKIELGQQLFPNFFDNSPHNAVNLRQNKKETRVFLNARKIKQRVAHLTNARK
jgi:hypothetical protein